MYEFIYFNVSFLNDPISNLFLLFIVELLPCNLNYASNTNAYNGLAINKTSSN